MFLESLSCPKSIEVLWDEFQDIRGKFNGSWHSVDNLILSLNLLYTLNLVELENDLLKRIEKMKEFENQRENQLIELKNRRVCIENALFNIQKSMKVKPDLDKERLLSLYEEIIEEFKPELLQRIEVVEAFNQQILKKRLKLLMGEKFKLEKELAQVDEQIEALNAF